jgi:hypothetical protein
MDLGVSAPDQGTNIILICRLYTVSCERCHRRTRDCSIQSMCIVASTVLSVATGVADRSHAEALEEAKYINRLGLLSLALQRSLPTNDRDFDRRWIWRDLSHEES